MARGLSFDRSLGFPKGCVNSPTPSCFLGCEAECRACKFWLGGCSRDCCSAHLRTPLLGRDWRCSRSPASQPTGGGIGAAAGEALPSPSWGWECLVGTSWECPSPVA